MKKWDRVRDAANNAKGISFDGCHKIYVLMDDESVDTQRAYEYGEYGESRLITGLSGSEYTALIKEWYQNSCFLRFVDSISSSSKFTTLIGQH